MALLVTSAAGKNGAGNGALLAFAPDGRALGAFSNDPRIADPRGLAVEYDEGLLFLNSGTNRVVAIDATGRLVRDSGRIEGLNPGGGNFGPNGRYYVGSRTAAHDCRISELARRARRAVPSSRRWKRPRRADPEAAPHH